MSCRKHLVRSRKWQNVKLQPVQIVPNGDGSLFVKAVGLPGCMSEGDDVFDALDMITDAIRVYKKVEKEDEKNPILV